MTCRIALHGFARVGKDEVGKILMRRFGLVRVALGDIIKRQLDPLIKKELGFSAFTQIDTEKVVIRETLVRWGYANYSNILREFMHDLPGRCVSTRIFRLEECIAWREKGGMVIEVTRPGFEPAEPMEAVELERCFANGLIDVSIVNHGSLEDLEKKVLSVMLHHFDYGEILRAG